LQQYLGAVKIEDNNSVDDEDGVKDCWVYFSIFFEYFGSGTNIQGLEDGTNSVQSGSSTP